MKKILIVLLIIVAAVGGYFCASFGRNVDIDLGGGDTTIENSDIFALVSSTPTREGFVFGGWYSDPAFKTKVNEENWLSFATVHTLYAHWISLDPITYNVRNSVVTITDEGRAYQTADVVDLSGDFDFSSLRDAGIERLHISVSFKARECDDGYQYCFIYPGLACTRKDNSLFGVIERNIIGEQSQGSDHCLFEYQFELGSGHRSTSWETVFFETTLLLDDLQAEALVLRYGASGKYDDNWQNTDVIISVTPVT